MKKTEREMLHRAADIIAQYANELRRSNVVNGAWSGAGVAEIRSEWSGLIRVSRGLRALAGKRPCF